MKIVESARDRDPLARHADLETASIPRELDVGKYRRAQEVTDPPWAAKPVDTRAFLLDLTKQTVLRTSADPDRLDVVAALRPGTRA